MAIDETFFWSWHARDKRQPTASPQSSYRHPVRINRSERSKYIFQSNVTKRDHPCHSYNEYLWHLMLDVTVSVADFTSQTYVLPYSSEGEKRIYTADTFVWLLTGRKILAEVKPEHRIDDPEDAQKWLDVEIAAAAVGADFLFVPDTYLERQPRKSNVWEIHKHRHYETPSEVIYAILRRFEACDAIALGALAEPVLGQPYDRVWMICFIKGLIYRRFLTFNFNEALTPETAIHLANRS